MVLGECVLELWTDVGEVDVDVMILFDEIHIVEEGFDDLCGVLCEVFVEFVEVLFFFVGTIFSSDNIDCSIGELPFSYFLWEAR